MPKWFGLGVIIHKVFLYDVTDICPFCFSEQVFVLFVGETVVAQVSSFLGLSVESHLLLNHSSERAFQPWDSVPVGALN